ncbi:MAG TPA: YhjD/YihY/BrkB family envelope integrity protein [Candidatus Acidoferrales bacterium]|nr:YhjD/YihY/BrkB family envelope integrity protein [Candidatus Acidoferrales bacterium]
MPKRSFSRLAKILTGRNAGGESEFDRLERFAHFWVLVARSFVRNRCLVRASALSYTTLLALIPLLAVAISVTSSLLKKTGEEQIYRFVDNIVSSVMPPATLETNAPPNAAVAVAPAISPLETNFPAGMVGQTNSIEPAKDQQVVLAQKEVARDIHEFIRNTRSGALGLTGMVVLIFVAISMLNRIESTFNDIWGVTSGRHWLLRIVYYWTTITLGPLLLAAALGLGNGNHLQAAKGIIHSTPIFGALLFHLLPLVVIWLTFALIYRLIPNTKVHFDAALVGGLVGGTLWHLNNSFGFLYVSRVVTNSKIYGSLGLVPVFMAGLYLSWVILLFGAQVAYAFQNRKSYLQDKLAENVNQRGREFIALRLMTSIAHRFQNGQPPPTVQDLSSELAIPTRLAQQVLQPLLAARLVTEISGAENSYCPARPLEAINAHHILRSMRSGNGDETVTSDEPVRAEVLGEFARIEAAEREAASQISLLSLVQRVQKQITDAPPARKDTPKGR